MLDYCSRSSAPVASDWNNSREFVPVPVEVIECAGYK